MVRVVTPGTLTDEALLDARRDNLIAAVCRGAADGSIGLAWLELSAGPLLRDGARRARRTWPASSSG